MIIEKHHLCLALAGGTILAVYPVSPALAKQAGSEDAGEIVVTAQRRDENIVDVPISVTALSSQTLEQVGVRDSRDLAIVTPGLRVDSVGAYVQPAIRGVTTTLTSGPEANIATYLDGVYRPNTFGAIYELPDVEQVEVLKGPQGTLFGRNATGGAILITTRKPDLQSVGGTFEAGYGRFGAVTLSGFASAPLVSDKLAVSLTGYWEDIARGWKRNLVTGKRHGADVETGLIRGKLRAVPWDGADFTLNGLYSWRNDASAYRTSIWHGNHDFAGLPGVLIATRPWTYAIDYPSKHDSRGVDVSLRGDIAVGPGTLTTTTAYSYTWADLLFDTDNARNNGTFATTDTAYESFTQELVYASEQLGPARFVTGLFFYDSQSDTQPYYVKASRFQLWGRDEATSYAAFGELTYDLTDRLSLTGGLRYSYEKRTAAAALGSGDPPFARPTMTRLGRKSWDAFTPRAVIQYTLDRDTNLYASFSQGFKSGIFNTPGFQRTPVNPEKIDAYEAGIKSAALPGLRLTAAAFHYDYRDLQVPTIELVGSVLTQRILNAATAKINGAEFNLDWDAGSGFKLLAGLSYLDAKYKSFRNASVNVPVAELSPPGNSRCTEAVKPTSGLCNMIIDATGNTMIRSPKWSGSITGSFTHEYSNGTLALSATLYASTKVYHEYGNRVVQPSFAKLNAFAGWSFSNGLGIRLWGRNLTNEPVLTSLVSTSTYDSVDYERPREYGVTFKYEF